MTELSTAYQPQDIEEHWYRAWLQAGTFRARPNPEKRPFCIVIPPPNVTGALHMGHALNNTLQDVLVRRARMQGYETLWLPGTDHAGIATQNVVERELRKDGLTRHDLGRERFVEKVWEWKERYGSRIIMQLQKLGCSCDWDRTRFTMDEGLSRAVRTIFVRWFEEGLIYRGLRIINWCPRCTTALSDIEVEHEETAGELVTFRYDLTDGSGSISVATTRVETMLGDTGIAVNPNDDRYLDLVGKRVRHPFFADRDVPIVADDAVDLEFGTGAVKVTPAHDPTDFDIGARHELDKINIFDEHATTTAEAGGFAGLDRYAAREAVLRALRERGVVENEERPYVHPVGHCSRCGTEVEPWLSEQWFVKMQPLARPAVDVVTRGEITFHPERFAKQYVDWMDNIRDWCISRQLWWGHRIPVWYCDDCGEAFASLDDPETCRECRSGSIRQDPDVLDTWFSSQLWPFSTLGWPDRTDDLAYFYPTTLLCTGYDILFFWVARMIVSGVYAMDDVPFREVFLTGLVRDFEGKKMSKSAGNVIDPLDVVERYGADALRFALAFATVPGNDTNLSEERIEAARNFANKLWNATRFVLMALGDERPEPPPRDELSVTDRWILSRLDATIEEVERWYLSYNFGELSRVLYRFIWSEYCDWYIELAKLNLEGESEVQTRAVLLHVLDRILRMLHPIMPFITEDLWQKVRGKGSVMTAPWPQPEGLQDPRAEATVRRLQEIVVEIRRLRSEHDVEPSQRPTAWHAGLDGLRDEVQRLARVELADQRPSGSGRYVRSVTPSGDEVELALDVDVEAEANRLRKKLAAFEQDLAAAERKLSNEQFTSKAPPAVVDKERRKLEEARAGRDKVKAQLDALGV